MGVEMANQFELEDLHKKLLNRKCYTMADVIKGGMDTGDNKISSSQILESLTKSPFYGIILKHTKAQDATAAINELTGIVMDAAAPDAIGREFVRIIETVKESIKVRLPSRGKAKKTGRKTSTTSRGQRETFVTLTPDKEFEARDVWDTNYLEDADWDVASEEAAETARALAELESQVLIDHIQAIATASLATDALVSAATAGTLAYTDLVNLWSAIRGEDFHPDKVYMHTDQAGDLFKDPDFKDSTILGEFVDIAAGRFGRTILGVDIFVSTQVPKTEVTMVDSKLGVMYALRRDKMVTTFELPPNETGIQISTRYDIENGRTKAISRIEDA